MTRTPLIGLTIALLAGPVAAGGEQLGQIGKIGGAVKKANDVRDLQMTDAEEQTLGQEVSERIRTRYGVVQDAAVHRYVALVGTSLAQASTRPGLPWTFIVLDTDGVNAFAAPGGYVHVTRGALALIESEAELAGVLGHEIIHVTERHTIKAIQKSKAVQMGASETLSNSSELLEKAATATYENVVEKGFGREEENESDEKGVELANRIGYAPAGLNGFLTRLKERNKDATEKRGLFASHPEMEARLENLKKEIAARKLASTATLQDRYRKFISYTPKPASEIATVTPGSAGLTGDTAKAEPKKEDATKEEPKKKSGFGLSKMLPTGGGEKQQAQVTGSGSARGVDPEKDSTGGANPKLVPVKLAAADIAAFKKEGGLK
jgi:beta-barrel assembly-enhancing protease